MNTQRSVETEFPRFDLDVQIPEGFKDISYRNDACPSWYHEGQQTLLYIEYAKPEDRDEPEIERARFSLAQQDFEKDAEPHSWFHSDDWQAVQKEIRLRLATAIAKAFGRIFREQVGEAKALMAVELNRTIGNHACATHDFCDANMVMLPAMTEVLGYEPALSEDNPKMADECRLWGEAWEIAKANDLFFPVASRFRAFQATREEHADLRKVCDGTWGDEDKAPAGFAYLNGGLYIEKVGADWPEKARQQGAYYLIIGNQEWITDDLEALEKRLFGFAVTEGFDIPAAH